MPDQSPSTYRVTHRAMSVYAASLRDLKTAESSAESARSEGAKDVGVEEDRSGKFQVVCASTLCVGSRLDFDSARTLVSKCKDQGHEDIVMMDEQTKEQETLSTSDRTGP